MKNILCLLAVFLLYTAASAQNSLTGSITSKIKKEPVSATVYIQQLEKGTAADFDGNYMLKNIPDGNYNVVFSSLGYATISKKINFSNSQNVTENLQLEESAVEMEEVIVSTPFHKLQSDNVMKVERISTQDLNASGAITLADGIKNIAGVNIISTGTGIGKPVIRGLSSNRVLTYTQGVRLENQQFGDEHGLGINDSGVESVEVIKGPASLLYGSDALGGVLYLNPEKFAISGETHGDLSSTYFSNTLATSTNLGVKTSGEKLKFLARGSYSSFSDYKSGGDYRVTNSRFNEKDFKTGVQYLGGKFKSTLRYNYNRSNIGIAEEIGEQSHSKDLELPFQEIDNHILSFDNTVFFNNSSLDVKAGYLFNDRREFEDDKATAALRLKLKTFNYDVKYNLPELGNFETIVGLQGMFQNNKNEGEEILIPDANTTDIGLLATSHYHLEKIDFQAGIRFDSRKIESEAARNPLEEDFISALDKTFTSFTAALGAKLDLVKNLSARINLASGFRAPNLAELTSNGIHEGTNRYERGNQNLTNEQNFQTDIALEYRNEHVELFANGFYNAVSDYIFISPTNEMMDDTPVYDYLQNNANLYGGEFGFHLHPHPLDWLHFESSFETVTGKLDNDDYLPLIPANSLRNTFRVELNDGKTRKSSSAFVTLENTFSQKNISKFETRTGGYSLLSAGIESSFQLQKVLLKLGINGTNLTDKAYVSHLSRFKPDGIFNIGRSINVNLKVEI
ncbi:outer membrane receptor protein [Aequorivita sublithincola DSM 14238]|uniref:Outer membrane receptor protein n=1 Tax=Aequorivita sublithincola (strain DSM 14238 / LMG 21431 / ACAM 643 / 9-3) TaxID=746697 RepID=I3YZ19_AEQSU|nr:TonB-dependent receptor [Aequorivita sublithincola]AFL82237.1 outer membrane receptor protein [Aequorivita sublithincola DSM 14238]